MQNADGSKYCRFCGDALMQSSGAAPSRKPYSWQSEEFQVNDRTQNYQAAKKTQVFTPPPPPANYPQNSPQMVQPMQPAPLYNQHQQPHQQPQQHQYPNAQYYALQQHYYCPNCRTQVHPRVERKIAPAGWIVFAVLLVSFFPLFWLGFFIKEDRRSCPICRTRLL
jgi:hypothetical protein